MGLKNRDDRICEYLLPHLNNYLFDELSEKYLKKAGLDDILSGVPIPVRKDEINAVSTETIAKGMAFVIGCDPKFKYTDNYIAYIFRVSDKSFAYALVAEGVENARKNEYEHACINFRAAMLLDPENVDALYCYGRACKDAYENGDDEDFIARFKAESLEAFEEVTLCRPDFAEAYYFLGYGYINLGLYIKAKLTWDEFMKLSKDEEKKKEISERLDSLEEPVEIEEGYNMILSGKFDDGIAVLEKYTESKFQDWWPLWYYLGVAYSCVGELRAAEEHLKRVLKLSPSNTETMSELVNVYEKLGEEEMAEKYRKKIEIVAENVEKDREEVMKDRGVKIN